MPYFRHRTTGELAHTKAGSGRDKDLAADPAWGRTPDSDDSQAEPSSDLNADPVELVIPDDPTTTKNTTKTT